MRNKKGQMTDAITGLGALIIPLVVIAIVLVVGFLIMAEAKVQDAAITGTPCDATNGSIGCNATKIVQQSLDDIPPWLPIIVITVIGAFLIGLVAVFRGVR